MFVTACVPLRLRSTANLREHWAQKASRIKTERYAAFYGLCEVSPAWNQWETSPLRVTITRIAPRTLDDDNLVSCCKAVRDGIAQWLDTPDNDPSITWVYAQRREGVGEYAVEMTVEAVHDEKEFGNGNTIA